MIVVQCAHARETNHDMRLLERSFHHGVAADVARVIDMRRRARRQALELVRDARHQRVMVNRPGRRQHRDPRAVAALQIGGDGGRVERADRFARAENRPSHGLIGPRAFGEQVEHPIVGRVLDGADLLNDHAFFALQFVRGELAVGDDVGEHVEREVDIFAKHPREISGLLDAGLGVEVAADVLDRFGDLFCAAPARAFEGHVLEHMREAVFLLALMARARAEIEAERGGLEMGKGVSDDPQPRCESRNAHAH